MSGRDDRIVGALAAASSLAASELAAGLFPALPSLVSGVATAVIDVVPAPVKDTVIALFGTADKVVLGVGIVVVVLGLGAAVVPRVAGSARAAVFVAFGILGAWAAARSPLAAPVPAIVNGGLAAGAGIVTGRWLATATPGVGPDGERRRFLRMAGMVAAGAVVAGVVGTVLSDRVRPRAVGLLPEPAEVAAAPPPELPVVGISPLVTPNNDFFRIDTVPFFPPRVDVEEWTLRVTGLVESEMRLTYAEVAELPLIERHITLSCVSNEVGGDLVGTARWLGYPLADLLDRAGVMSEATQVVARSVDGFTVGFPVEALYDGREALVAIGMNGEPLPAEHGYPARLVVSGLYGYVSATKWLAEIELTTWDAFDAYWVRRGWSKEAPVKTQSRIDTPRHGERIEPGRRSIAGVAWAPNRGVGRVEVRVDGHPWQQAELSEPMSVDAWRQWRISWDAAPGTHTIEVRATDGDGETQTDKKLPPAPNGATGYHAVTVEV